MQSDAPGWIGICVWSRGKWLFVIFLSCRGVNSENCISNLRKRMNGMIFHQWQAQRYFHCFLWRLLKVHRSELGEEFWALPETARDSGLIFCWHMPQWNTENKVWATKPIKKRRVLICFDLTGLFFYFTELSLPLSHCSYSNSDNCEITAGMRDTLGKLGKCQAQIAVRMESFVCFSMMSVNHNCVWMLLAKRCCDFSVRKLAFPAGTLTGACFWEGWSLLSLKSQSVLVGRPMLRGCLQL